MAQPYSEEEEEILQSHSCDPNTHYQSATGTWITACTPLTTCTDSQYESQASTATSDRTCTPLTACAQNEWQSQAPTATTDRQCSSNCTGVWGDWGACSATCGPNGKRSRSYVVSAEAKGVGTCPNKNRTQEQPCNRHACAAEADADCVGAWGEWSPCSAACGTGFSKKSYVVTSGTCANEGEQRTEECNTQKCVVEEEDGKKSSSNATIFLGGAIVLVVIALVALEARKASRKK